MSDHISISHNLNYTDETHYGHIVYILVLEVVLKKNTCNDAALPTGSTTWCKQGMATGFYCNLHFVFFMSGQRLFSVGLGRTSTLQCECVLTGKVIRFYSSWIESVVGLADELLSASVFEASYDLPTRWKVFCVDNASWVASTNLNRKQCQKHQIKAEPSRSNGMYIIVRLCDVCIACG